QSGDVRVGPRLPLPHVVRREVVAVQVAHRPEQVVVAVDHGALCPQVVDVAHSSPLSRRTTYARTAAEIGDSLTRPARTASTRSATGTQIRSMSAYSCSSAKSPRSACRSPRAR